MGWLSNSQASAAHIHCHRPGLRKPGELWAPADAAWLTGLSVTDTPLPQTTPRQRAWMERNRCLGVSTSQAILTQVSDHQSRTGLEPNLLHTLKSETFQPQGQLPRACGARPPDTATRSHADNASPSITPAGPHSRPLASHRVPTGASALLPPRSASELNRRIINIGAQSALPCFGNLFLVVPLTRKGLSCKLGPGMSCSKLHGASDS